jgi:hypothetical protein
VRAGRPERDALGADRAAPARALDVNAGEDLARGGAQRGGDLVPAGREHAVEQPLRGREELDVARAHLRWWAD